MYSVYTAATYIIVLKPSSLICRTLCCWSLFFFFNAISYDIESFWPILFILYKRAICCPLANHRSINLQINESCVFLSLRFYVVYVYEGRAVAVFLDIIAGRLR